MKILLTFFHFFETYRDGFLPHAIKLDDDLDIVYRFRLLAGINLIVIALVGLFVVFFPFISHFSWPGSFVSTSLCLLLLACNLMIVKDLKYQTQIEKPAHQTICAILITIALGVVSTGGVLDSMIPVFLQLPVILGFLILNRRAGITYALISTAIYVLFAYIEIYHWEFPNTIPDDYDHWIELMLWLYFAACILSLTLIYDDLTHKLMHARKQEQEKQTYLATHDSLTGLANRQKFDDYLNEALLRAQRQQHQVALMIIDLNDFKPINDTFGHDLGDLTLIHVAQQIDATIRGDDLGARIGGDEFAVIIQGSLDNDKIQQLAQRLINNISQPFSKDDTNLTVTASIGIACYPAQANDEEDLRQKADKAMYYAKHHTDKLWCNVSEIP